MAEMPELLSEFLRDIIRPHNPKTIFDPGADTSLLIIPLLEDFPDAHITGWFQDARLASLVEWYIQGSGAAGRTTISIDTIVECFERNSSPPSNIDAVIHCVEFGRSRGVATVQCEINGQVVRVRDDVENLTILLSSLSLSPDGIGIFVVPRSFFLRNSGGKLHPNPPSSSSSHSLSANTAKEALQFAGFQIRLCVDLPQNIQQPVTQIPSHVMVLQRSAKTQEMTAVEYRPDEYFQKTIINALYSPSKKIDIDDAIHVNADDYRGLDFIKAVTAMQNVFSPSNGQLVELSLFSKFHKRKVVGAAHQSAGQVSSNSLFLSLHPTAPFASAYSQDYASGGLGGYGVSLSIDPAIADAEYVACLLNSKAREIRELLKNQQSSMAFAGRYNLLMHLKIPLPRGEERKAIARVFKTIQGYTTALHALTNRLATTPSDYEVVLADLKKLGQEDQLA